MQDVIMRFNKGLDSYLTKEQLRNSTPVIFSKAPTNPGVSEKYLFVNSETIIDDLAKLNWFPVTSAQRKVTKTEGTIYSKHLISFQNPDIQIISKDGDNAFPRIIMTNSHDGLQSFRFSVGIFRLVCSNGLVIADEQFSDFRINHKGYTFDELRDVISQAVKDLPNRVEVLNKMRNKILTNEQKEKLALDAMLVRAGITPDSSKANEFSYDKETLQNILEPKRKEDVGDNLWLVLNVIQEKIMHGDFHAALVGAKIRKVRPIKSFEKSLEVNKDLFKLATALL